MKKSRFTDAQILEILMPGERGLLVADLCREHGISNATYYNWRSKFGGMDASLNLRNVKGFGWNHKRVRRIYRELELNLRIKPKKRLVREKPEPLAVPEALNAAHCAGSTDLASVSRVAGSGQADLQVSLDSTGEGSRCRLENSRLLFISLIRTRSFQGAVCGR